MFKKDGITWTSWQEYNLTQKIDRDLAKQKRKAESQHKSNQHKNKTDLRRAQRPHS